MRCLCCVVKPFKCAGKAFFTKPVHALTNLAHLSIVAWIGVRFCEKYLTEGRRPDRV